jgi:hypothetical protein
VRQGRQDRGCLLAETPIEKACHNAQRLFGLGQAVVVPERMRQRLEDDQFRRHARAQESPMQEGGSAQQDVARAGHE